MERLFDNSDGSYLPAFLYIQLNENIDFQNFENHSDEVKGTFIHEYCHFLQDVSTTYGYTNFLCYIQEFLYKIGKVKDSEDCEVLQHIPIRLEELKSCFDEVLNEYRDKYDVIYFGYSCGVIEYNILLNTIQAQPIERSVYNRLQYEARLKVEA